MIFILIRTLIHLKWLEKKNSIKNFALLEQTDYGEKISTC